MSNVCIVRHQGYIKSKMRFPYQHNFKSSLHKKDYCKSLKYGWNAT